jgi:hypothetical protein
LAKKGKKERCTMRNVSQTIAAMGSKPSKVNSVTIPAGMLEKIAATSHLAVSEVVRLFLVEALPKGKWNLGALEVSSASLRRFAYKNRALPR